MSDALRELERMTHNPWCTDCDQTTTLVGCDQDRRCANCGSGRWYYTTRVIAQQDKEAGRG